MTTVRRRQRRGFTLLEILVVVAIVAVLSALSGYGLIEAARLGRVNAATSALTSALSAARIRAVTQQCTHFAQINGPTYVPGSPPPGAPRRGSSVSIVRKANCDSTNYFFEGTGVPGADDVVVDTLFFSDAKVDLQVTPGVLPSNDLINSSVIVAYNRLGQRQLAADQSGAGFSPVTSVPITTPVTVVVRPNQMLTNERQISVPGANGPSAN